MNTLERWTRPQHYIGQEWPEYFGAGVGRSRDSDALERANFDATLAALRAVESKDGDAEGNRAVVVVRETHWAVGWIEWIAIHETDTNALEIALGVKSKLENYPIVDEELFGRYEDEDCRIVWEQCFDPQDRLEYLRNHSYTAHDLKDLFQAVRAGSWEYAANVSHCPSEVAL